LGEWVYWIVAAWLVATWQIWKNLEREHVMATMPGRRRRWRRGGKPGVPPGTIEVDPDAPAPVIGVLAYGPEKYVEQEIQDIESLGEFVGRWPVVWVNVDGLGDAEALAKLAEVFGLHRLVIEDIANVPQRPKVEQYGEDLFIVSRMAAVCERLDVEQISVFLGQGVVLSFQEHPGDCLDPVRDRIRKALGRIRAQGPDYLVYAIVDAVIDGYFPILEEFGERLEALEEDVLSDPGPEVISRIYAAKRDLLTMRRAVWPQRESVNWLSRESCPVIQESTRLYLRDSYDHVAQIMDMVETFRELALGLVEGYQSSMSNRMNEVMKVLTIIATIFIPLSFVAGLYGMNFNPEKSPLNMPELAWYWGYPFALGLMTAIAVGMVVYFWRKGWLRSSSTTLKKDR